MGVPVQADSLRSTIGREPYHTEAMRRISGQTRRVYEAHVFSLPTATTNFSLKADLDHVADCSCGRAAFDRVLLGRRALIINRGVGEITTRFISTLLDPFPVYDGEQLHWDLAEFDDILFSNATGASAPLRVVMV